MGIRVHAGTSRAMEGLAKAVMLLMTQELSGAKLSVVDSAAATFSRDGLPEFGTWLDDYVREALRTVDVGSFREGWVQAQHDSRSTEFLAYCNKVAHDLADKGKAQGKLHSLPALGPWVSGPVFHVAGRVVVQANSTLDKIYDDLTLEGARHGLTGYEPRWSAMAFVAALKEGRITSEGIKALMLLRQLGMQEVREGESPPCRWCGAADSQRRDHLEHHCAVFYLRRVRVFTLIVGDLKSQQGWELKALDDQEAEFRWRGKSVEAATIFLGACGAKGKPLPDCHFWSFSGAGDVSGAHKNIKRRAAPCAHRANTPPITYSP